MAMRDRVLRDLRTMRSDRSRACCSATSSQIPGLAREFTGRARSCPTFRAQIRRRCYAVVRCLEIVSEASRRRRRPRCARGMLAPALEARSRPSGNIYRHEYHLMRDGDGVEGRADQALPVLLSCDGSGTAPRRSDGALHPPQRSPRSPPMLPLAIRLAALVPLLAGGAGALFGPAFLGEAAGPATASHLRYLSGLLLGLGGLAWWCAADLRPRRRVFAALCGHGGGRRPGAAARAGRGRAAALAACRGARDGARRGAGALAMVPAGCAERFPKRRRRAITPACPKTPPTPPAASTSSPRRSCRPTSPTSSPRRSMPATSPACSSA